MTPEEQYQWLNIQEGLERERDRVDRRLGALLLLGYVALVVFASGSWAGWW